MSINIGMSGLKSTTEQMNTISQNIANVGTIGYKSSRTEFQDIYAPEFGGGQMNGVEVSTTRQSFMSGTTTPTGRNSDLAINGEGFFMVQSNGQQMFTRNGVMNLDADGYLVTADGYRLQGYDATDTGLIQTGNMGDLTVSTGDMAAKITTKVNQGLNLDANSAAIDTTKKPFDREDPTTFTSSTTTTIYDSIGGEHEMTQYFVKTGDNQWQAHYVLDDQKAPMQTEAVVFNAEGKMVTPAGGVSLTFTPGNGANQQTVTFDMAEVSQYGSKFSINKNAQDGYAPGKLAAGILKMTARYTHVIPMARPRPRARLCWRASRIRKVCSRLVVPAGPRVLPPVHH